MPPTGKVVYNETVGVGCPDPDARSSITKDDPSPAIHPWTKVPVTGGNGGPCADQLIYSALTTHYQTPDVWINEFGWNFTQVPRGATCWFAVYIADSDFSSYTQAQYNATATIGTYPDDPTFTINQDAYRGLWVEEYSSPPDTTTGTVQLLVTDGGSGTAGQTVTASAVNLQCV